MIELQGTLTERMEKAVALVCDEVTDAQVVHFHDIYTKAGISLSDAAVKFFKTYGGAYRSSYIVLSDPRYDQAVFFRCYGNDETTDNLDNAMEYIDLIETAAGQEVCPVAMIGFDIPAEAQSGFMSNDDTVLVPVDGRDIYYTRDQASNFDDIYGKNTHYVTNSEECLADNFAYAMLYGMKGKDGNGYPNPEIIQEILDYVK